MFCLRVIGLFFVIVFVLRLMVYAFAIVCCKVAFHIALVCSLHVCVAFVSLVRLFLLECLFCV